MFNTFNYSHTILIKPNQSLQDISRELHKNGIIKNKFLFKLIVKINRSEKKLKAGEYKFYKKNIFQIIKKIKVGDVYLRKITVPEGLTSIEILDILKKEEGIVFHEISVPKEGSLFPSTYFYSYGTSINLIIEKMQKSMNETLKEIWKNKYENVNLKDYYEVLILASIIEKETSLKEEKPIIAQVFLNRLNLNMKLQSDPTVIYGIKKKTGNFNRELTRKDLSFKSDYNTYLNRGLPSGPISNPGKDSIIAAVNPIQTDFLYFVANGFGGHDFAISYEEHLKNIKRIKENY